MSSQSVHDSLNLYISPDTFTFEAQSSNKQTLVIYRDTGDVKLNGPYTPRHEEELLVYGIFGIVRLNAGDHLIVITERESLGYVANNEVYRVKGHRILPFTRGNRALAQVEKNDDEQYLAMIEAVLGLDNFFFSYSYQLTQSLQRQSKMATDTRPLWQKADDRFFYNKHLATKLIDASSPQHDLSGFILPIICGSVQISPANINGKFFNFALIARRSRHRNGTRYHSRGIDEDGNVSNYVETEQLAEVAEPLADRSRPNRWSYVQTRGSVPVFWKQNVNVQYTPTIVVEETGRLLDSFKKHFAEQEAIYGNQIAVNLVNKKGSEGRLGTAYTQIVKQLGDPKITYTWFDFHHECRNMRWDRISNLIDSIAPQLAQQGYTALDRDGRLVRNQTSVVRTNCVDCLDRTNVVQSVLARRALTLQLREAGALTERETVEDAVVFEKKFKAVWADHADAISIQYSGTPAMKTDFTRTGKRTTQGALADLTYSITRYVRNNFMDGSRQDAFDLVTGVYEVRPGGPSPLVEGDRGWRYRTLPYLLMFALIMLVGGFLLPSPSRSSQLLYTLFFLAIIVFCVYDILKHGRDFVDLPRLVKPRRTVGDAINGRISNGLQKKD
ncbi:hypothetical protein M427DRAFT_54348 [Gonapodya prolifera JEL478]|uniref:SAC domain-containing protein n=1 Tax=Gonapodya prolifera (strain JEL478) TaxID=1344416 RepID=A0A139AM37_GONPJ|nr:hypothetical protein M427DRAFT_54348 [Gonapodya prolifera JEL478]|eukprot:KXS17758.1 hypothetical protein M427DRAFT_54348 [Gonapodya prolifera JEL478]